MLSRSGAQLLRALGARAAPAGSSAALFSSQSLKGACRNRIPVAALPLGVAARGDFGTDGPAPGISRGAALDSRPPAPFNAIC
jgi:hypothetical protein